MIVAIAIDIWGGDPSVGDKDYGIYPTKNFAVLLIKFVSSCALHLMLYPHVEKSMKMMKYISNHSAGFSNPHICFNIVLLNHCINLSAEIINLWMLSYQHYVEKCIIYFVALEIMVEIPHLMIGSLTDDRLKQRIFTNLD